ncbi:MAG: hypothetical protein ACI9G1_001021 [Pirellulaceae bacterium]|jgi:hypothetical protein
MSWRGDNSDKKRKPAKQSKPSNPAPSQKKERANWRKTGAAAGNEQKRSSWGAASGGGENAAEAAMYTHRLKIMVLAGVLFAVLVIAVVSLRNTVQKVPLIVISLADYAVENEHSFLAVNPYANEDASRFALVNTGNVRYVSTDTSTLREVQVNEDAISIALKNNRLPPIPGGPGKDYYIYYVSAYGAISSSGEACLLLSSSTLDDSDTWLPVERLIQQIESARGDGTETKTLIMLDVKFPDPIGENALNDGNFVAKLKGLFDPGQNRFSPNTFLFLAADTGQLSWTSAELGGSVFAYYAAVGLNGAADGAADVAKVAGDNTDNQVEEEIDNEITMGEFVSYVKSKVGSWVAQYRGAVQAPALLSTRESVEDALSNSMAYVGTVNPLPANVSVSVVTQRAEASSPLAALWETHQRLRVAEVYRKRPILWGRAEAKLIRLEQLLETGTSPAFERLLGSANSDLSTLEASQRSDRRALSLVEKQILKAAFDKELEIRAKKWVAELPPYLQPPRDDGLVPAIAPLKKDEAAWLTWLWLNDGPTADDKVVVKEYTLNHATLKKIIKFIDDWPEGESPNIEWIEIQFLKLLESELDWVAIDADKRADRVIHQAIKARKLAQEATIWADPAVHYWIRREADGVEDHRRIAEDHLFTGQLEEASEQFDKVIGELEGLILFGKRISRALKTRDKALVELPHFMVLDRRQNARQMALNEALPAPQEESPQEGANAAEAAGKAGPQDLRSAAADQDLLADLWRETFDLAILLRMENTGSVTVDNVEKLQLTTNRVEKLLDDQHRNFQQHVESLLDNASSGERHRQIQEALQSALVQPVFRQRLYAKLRDSIEEDKSIATSGKGNLNLEMASQEFDVEAFRKRFENHFTDSTLKNVFELMALERWDEYKGDRLAGVVKRLNDLESKSSSRTGEERTGEEQAGEEQTGEEQTGEEQYRTSISAANDLFKLMALFLAFRFEQGDFGGSAVEQIAVDAYDLHSHYERVWQAERALDDFWGSTKEQGDDYDYFWACSHAYLETAIRFRPTSSLIANFNKRAAATDLAMRKHTRVSSKEVKDVIEFSLDGDEERHQVRIDIPAALPRGYGIVRFQANQKIIPIVDCKSSESIRGHMFEIFESKVTKDLDHYIRIADLKTIEDRKLYATLAFRGHRSTHEIKLRPRKHLVQDKFFKIEFDSPSYDAPIVTVRGATSGMLDVLFVLDCSASMNDPIVVGENRKIELTRHEAAKNSLSSILDRMSEEPGRYRIGLLAFGHRARWTGKGWKMERLDGQSNGPSGDRRNVYVPTDVEVIHELNGSALPTDIVEYGQISQKLKGLRAAGSTPLYLSVKRGLEHLKMRQKEGIKQRLIIISDGVNVQEVLDRSAVAAGSMPKNYQHTTFDDLDTFVDSKYDDIGIDVVHFKPAKGAGQATTLDNYKSRLKNSEKIPQLTKVNGKYFPSSDFDNVTMVLRSLLPRTVYRVESANPTSTDWQILKQPFICSRFPLPTPHTVVVDNNGNPASREIELEGGENVEIVFDEAANDLLFDPYKTDSLQAITSALGEDEYTVRLHRPILRGKTIGFEFSFDNKSRKRFSRRPRTMWLEVHQRHAKDDLYVFNCYDFKFANGEPVPVAKFAHLPWYFENKDLSARVKLWVSMEKLTGREVSLAGAELDEMIGGDIAQIRRAGPSKVTITLKPQNAGEKVGDWLVRCQESDHVLRKYVLRKDEQRGEYAIHEFTLLEGTAIGDPLHFEFMSKQELTGKCAELSFDQFPTENR